jgi:hypothetical protein
MKVILAEESDPEIKIFSPKVKERSLKISKFKPSFYIASPDAMTSPMTSPMNSPMNVTKAYTASDMASTKAPTKKTIVISSDEEDLIQPVKKKRLIRLADLEKEDLNPDPIGFYSKSNTVNAACIGTGYTDGGNTAIGTGYTGDGNTAIGTGDTGDGNDDKRSGKSNYETSSSDAIIEPVNSEDLMIDREIVEFLKTATVEEIIENFMASYDQALLITRQRVNDLSDRIDGDLNDRIDGDLSDIVNDGDRIDDDVIRDDDEEIVETVKDVGHLNTVIDLTGSDNDLDRPKVVSSNGDYTSMTSGSTTKLTVDAINNVDANNTTVDAINNVDANNTTVDAINTVDANNTVDKPKLGRPGKPKKVPETYHDWEVFCRANGMTRTLSKYRDILKDLGSVDGIIKHCDMVGRDLKRSLDYWGMCEPNQSPRDWSMMIIHIITTRNS